MAHPACFPLRQRARIRPLITLPATVGIAAGNSTLGARVLLLVTGLALAIAVLGLVDFGMESIFGAPTQHDRALAPPPEVAHHGSPRTGEETEHGGSSTQAMHPLGSTARFRIVGGADPRLQIGGSRATRLPLQSSVSMQTNTPEMLFTGDLRLDLAEMANTRRTPRIPEVAPPYPERYGR